MDIRILGPLQVERDGEVIDLGGPRQRSVLAALVLRAREVFSGERLADTIWAGNPPASARATLRAYLSNLRKALEPQRDTRGASSVLRTAQTGYVLNVADEQIDARRFESLVVCGRERRAAGDATAAVEAWNEALSLWRGEALQDFAKEVFVRSEAGRLSELRLACMEDLFDVRVELGQHDAVLAELGAFCDAHPGRERALALRVLALYRCGRRQDALSAYEKGRHRLADELGVDPSPELKATYEQIVRREPSGAPVEALTGKRTLTFLLGEVERSTEMLRALGDDYARVLRDQRRLLSESLVRHGALMVRTWGDRVFAAFDVATDAVRAAVVTQVVLGEEGLAEDRTLLVRMGLHTGEATLSAGEPVGLAINLASRIMGAAHGGQILVSRATADLVEAGDEVSFVEMGAHALKDFPDHVRLFQVTNPELRWEFPTLRTRAGLTDNLPVRRKSFVGREHEIEDIFDVLGEARVVTLTGVGGVGKTTLAVEAGRRLVTRYPDGVWLCELAPLVSGDETVHSLARTLGIQPQPGKPLRESLLGALAQRSSLVILDNCEHLLDPAAALVEDIAQLGSSTDVLATSREALGVEGERSLPVRSLTVEDATAGAVRLFEDRAREVRPDFGIDASTTGDVVEVCRRLDGIPLAIELAATRVLSMSPAQIATRLEDGFQFLRSGRAAVDRHRTLHAAIAWQHELLSPNERALFDRLSVFAGGFSLEAAEAVCGRGLDLDVTDGLASLVVKSMVTADVSGTEARYKLLETMRQYAQDRLIERGERDDILGAHARYFVEWLEEGASVNFAEVDVEVIHAFSREWSNLQAAQAWATSSGETDLALRLLAAASDFFVFQFRLEAFGWAEAAVSLPGAEAHREYPVVLALLARLALVRGDFAAAEELANRSLASIEDTADPRRVQPLIVLFSEPFFSGRFDDARAFLDDVLCVAEANGDTWSGVFGTGCTALMASYAGDHETAIKLADQCWSRARDLNAAMQASALYWVGEVRAEAGVEVARALEALARCIDLSRATGMGAGNAAAALTAASLRAKRGGYAEALVALRDVIDEFRLTGSWQMEWTTLRNLVELFARFSADEPAAVLLAASKESEFATPSYGTQAVRLAEIASELEERLGPDEFNAASARGSSLTDREAVAYAKAEIDRALELARAET